MPCTDGGPRVDPIMRERLDRVTYLLCAAVQKMRVAGILSGELLGWALQHEVEDARRALADALRARSYLSSDVNRIRELGGEPGGVLCAKVLERDAAIAAAKERLERALAACDETP